MTWSPEREVATALDDVATTSGVVIGLRRAQQLAWSCSRSAEPDSITPALIGAVGQNEDQLLSIAAVHGLSTTSGGAPSALLTDLLGDARLHVREHAAWGLSARPPHREAMGRLTSIVAGGGFAGMLAARTLRGWASSDFASVGAALLAARSSEGAEGQARIVETLGLVPGPAALRHLVGVARDLREPLEVRRAAVQSLEDRMNDVEARSALHDLARRDDVLSADALLGLLSHRVAGDTRLVRPGLRIAQLYLYADLESSLEGAGAHDSGGVATLLALLSGALSDHADVAEVLSLSRGSVTDAITSALGVQDGRERFGSVPFDAAESLTPRTAWTRRIEIERGVRRVLRSAPPDLIHLRFADVGTMAATAVARQLEIPVVFTAAPDPHAVLDLLEESGELTRAGFGDSDAREHWWFRARMVEQLTVQADRVALLPRVGMRDEFVELLGFDLTEHIHRSAVIPEGVHAGTVRRAAVELERADHDARRSPDTARWPAGVDALIDVIRRQPPLRHGLPLLVTVGRLHPAKGIERVVRAWATSGLAERTNLVVIGGDLSNPSRDEREVLASIADHVGRPGLILLGRRPHAQVANILRAAAQGAFPAIGVHGVYACGAAKEEFGLAIVEALGAGLPVVAPTRGGPASYVRHGESGVLVDTTSVPALVDGIDRALALATDRIVIDDASGRVLTELTIEAMADRLVELYHSVSAVAAGSGRR